jgi:L-lactate dehydrogenase complex protein LldG
MSTTRNDLLTRLRTILARPDLPFPPPVAPPLAEDEYLTVTHAEGDPLALAHRFGAELTKLYGSYEVIDTMVEARLAVINRLHEWMAEEDAARKGPKLETGQETLVLSWKPEALPVEGLAESLHDVGMTLHAPTDLRLPERLEAVRFIRYGVTGVEAAFAATGSMLMVAGPQTNRSASLLPLRHLALIPFSRLYPTLEAWLKIRREAGTLVELMRSRANWSLITGPSKSADIEMNLTLGVHGPKYVHAILFDDRRDRTITGDE